MMLKEKFPLLKKLEPSKETKKIITTAVITFLVFAFFIWLGVGMYISVPEGSRGGLWPLFGLYFVFPALIFIFGAKRVYDVLNGREEPEDEPEEDEEQIEE